MSTPSDPLPGIRRRHDPDPTLAQSGGVVADDTSAESVGADSAPSVAFGPPAAPGEVGTLGPYRAVRQLGRGGMGAVYLAIDTRLNRKLALKVMLPQYAANQQARERFLREARAAAQISHDNVVTVYEADERDGVPYISMQFLQGCPLDEYLKKKGAPSLSQILRVARETASGLAAAHRIGLVHRDIKPANLWLEAPNGRVKVLDFGLAKPVDSEIELTKSGTVVGTPAYMSPEQGRGLKVDHRTDLFSLGGLLYRLCTGRLPFEGPTTMAVLTALATDEPRAVRELNPAVSGPLADFIHQLLAKNPDDRPQSAEEVVKRIRALQEGAVAPAITAASQQPEVVYIPIQVTALEDASPFEDIDATKSELVSRASDSPPIRQKRRRQWRWAVAALVVLIAMIAGAVIIVKNKGTTKATVEEPNAIVTTKEKKNKTVTPASSAGRFPVVDANRKGAEWVLSIGGAVQTNGHDQEFKVTTELPKDPLTLTGVNLNENKQVTDVGLSNLKECRSLTLLNLKFTPATDTGLAHLRDCKLLTKVSLSGTGVTDAGLFHLKHCTDLTELHLEWLEGVTDSGLANFKDCKKLQALALVSNRVTDAGLVYFKGCDDLKWLWLENVPITDTGLAHFKDCKKLIQLSLGGSAVTDKGLGNFKDHKQLAILTLRGTQITDAGLALFKNGNSWSHLDVRKTKVTSKGVEEFHAAFPGCGIFHDGGTIEPKK